MMRGTSKSAMCRQLWRVEEGIEALQDVGHIHREDRSAKGRGVGMRSGLSGGKLCGDEGSGEVAAGYTACKAEWTSAHAAERGKDVTVNTRTQCASGQQEWSCSRRKPRALGVQGGAVSWKGESGGQQGAEECFVKGVEKQLLGGSTILLGISDRYFGPFLLAIIHGSRMRGGLGNTPTNF